MSETNFLLTINARLLFNKNEKQEVTNVVRHVDGWPDSTGIKLKDPVN